MVSEERESLLRSRKDSRSVQYGSTANVQDDVSFDSGSLGEGVAEEGGPPPLRETVPAGALNLLSAKFESLDYDIPENSLLLEEESKRGHTYIVRKNLARWVVFFFIGVFTAFIGVIVDISIHQLSDIKYGLIQTSLNSGLLSEDRLYVPYLIWAGLNVAFVLVGSTLVTFIEPVAGGSGIPQVKCYLNGVRMPNIVRVKTLVVKVIGVITSVVGGLAGGKEGPMIHAGAFVAAGISQGKSSSIKTDFGFFRYFREDHEKRDFVSGGAAAGVAAAFGAPVGGVLFSLEEGASFWNQSLTWRIFFASSVSAFTLNIILSTYHGRPGQLNFYGLLNFGHFESLNYEIGELALFVLMGAIGGMIGSFYNYANYKLTVFRMRYVRLRWLKVLEACIVALISATVGMLMIFTLNDCKPLGQDPFNKYTIQMYCADGEYNSMASIWLQVPEASVRALFHDPPASHQVNTLIFFVLVYLTLSIWTYGLSVSAGIFIPCLLTGAAWGRLFGIGLGFLFPGVSWTDPGKYALVGAAAQLGGVVRMTLSLTVILIEATGNINFLLPLMVTLITAKWVGDYFCEGFYDIHIQLKGVPLLGWEPPPLSSTIYASSVMHSPVRTLATLEKVGRVVDILKHETFNGFPVVEPAVRSIKDGLKTYGKLRGLILRSQLVLLLQNKMFVEKPDNYNSTKCSISMFRDGYPRYPSIEDIKISEEERHYTLDLRPFMNPSPYSVQYVANLPRVFRLFRALGLRHLIVVNDINDVVGMVTRKDLAKYRWSHHGKGGIEVLKISEKN